MARNLTKEERNYFTKEFMKMDTNGNGWLSKSELKNGFRKWNGKKYTDSEIEVIFERLDKNEDGKITLDEYLNLQGNNKQTKS